MKSIRRCDRNVLYLTILLIFVIIFSLLGSNQFLITVAADQREFEVEKFDENITISPNALQGIDMDLQEGEKIEVIFTLVVKEELPIDVWFVNEDHYTLLSNGAQFLYFIDGSEQEVTYTRKIVTITEHDLYKLVITNYYNNQTVETNVIYEIRTFFTQSDDTSSENISSLVLPLSILVIVLVILLFILLVKARGYKQKLERVSRKAPSKKKKLRKSKKHKSKGKQKASSKKSEAHKSNETEPETNEKVSPGFCGHCGQPVNTPYCMNCGRKIQNS